MLVFSAVVPSKMSELVTAFVDGRPLDEPRSTFDAVYPATGAATGAVQLGTADDVDRAVLAARRALNGPWGQLTLDERASLLERVAALIDERFDQFVRAEVLDTGKPVSFARAVDIPRGAANFRSFAALARGLGDEAWHTHRPGVRALNYTQRSPVGVIGVICPWNLPLLLMTWKVAPALMMGNTVVVKPSEETPRTATLLAQVMIDAGVPAGVYNVVHGFGADSVGAALVSHPHVDAITFTGETSTGRHIQAAAAAGLKAVSFELGGKNAAIIFDDVDMDLALDGTTRSVFSNCGQVCLCSERVYVHRSRFEHFVERLAARARFMPLGDPMDGATQMGPLISHTQRRKVQTMVDAAVASGGELHAGGEPLDLPAGMEQGSWFAPTVVTGLPETHAFIQHEVFGPVCHVTPFDDDDEAISLANDTRYGLCAAVWTGNLNRAHHVAAAMNTGIVWVNDWFLRDLRTPFGGVGISGIGREGGHRSFEFYSEIKNICIRL